MRLARDILARFAAVPLLLIAAPPWIAGDLLAAGTAAPPSAAGAAAGAVALLALPHRAGRRIAIVLLSFLLAWLAADRVYRPVLPAHHLARWAPRRHALLVATLLADAERQAEGGRLWLAAEQLETPRGTQIVEGTLLVSVRRMRRDWQAGDRIRLRATIRSPRNFGNPGEFDYRGSLARRGIHVTASATDDAAIALLVRPVGGTAAAFGRWRRGVAAVFARALPAPEAGLLSALIVGTANELPPKLRTAFTRAGVAHVLSISGLHVGLAAAAGYAAGRWLLTRSRTLLLTGVVPKLVGVVATSTVLLYAGIAGTNVATVRSVIMIVVLLAAVTVDRQPHMLVSLAAAALAILLWAPGSAADISFQLSFVAVLGLVLGMERFWPWWQAREEARLARLRGWRARAARIVATYAAVSGVAFVATAPLTAFYFNQVTPMSLLANAVVVPLLGGATVVLGLVSAVAYLVWEPLAYACAVATWPAVAVGVWLVEALAAVPHAAWRVVTPSHLELTLMYGGLLGTVLLAGHWRRGLLGAVALLIAADAGWWYGQRYTHDDLRLTFLSVGQADSTVVELPGGEVLVVDAGGLGDSFDAGERIVAPFLWANKIGRVDYLVLSHAQWDHYGGLGFLAAQFGPRQLWWNGRPASSPRFAALRRTLAQLGAAEQVLTRGAVRRLGAVDVSVISPGNATPGMAPNEASLVLRLAFAGRDVLFTGDIEAGTERELLRTDPGVLPSTVLKVPHHGSRTSSTGSFVDAVAPAVAVVSAGFGNPFGFPHADVVRRYLARGAVAARTDADGAVTVRITPSGSVTIWTSRHGSLPCRPRTSSAVAPDDDDGDDDGVDSPIGEG